MTKSPKSVGVHEAKTTLSQLLRDVENGLEVHILRGKVPVARLVPMPPAGRRSLGIDKGHVFISPDFDETDPAIVSDFENGEHVPA